MGTYAYLPAVLLSAASWGLWVEEPPVVFARSGHRATLPIQGDPGTAVGPVALAAYGRQWARPVRAADGAVEFVAPEVRVPLAFQLVPAQDDKRALAELVVYPDRRVCWEGKELLACAAAPNWFDTWCDAVGLPIQKFKDRAALDSGRRRRRDGAGLLVLGRKAAGKDPGEICSLAAWHRTNVLVLEADWFGNTDGPNSAVAVIPKQLAGALNDWQSQQWALPPAFRRHSLPWPGLSNRETWIAGREYPLVEEIRSGQEGAGTLRIVLSYLPWQEQLGRREVADQLFLRLLAEAARGTSRRGPMDGRWRLLWPAARDIKAGERPVLAAALESAETASLEDAVPSIGARASEVHAYVLDLRGERPPPRLFKESGGLKEIEARIGADTPLLILGDDPGLETWTWLKADRQRYRSPRTGVVWWPDSSLPPSTGSQLRLMELLTEWGISLRKVSRETDDEDGRNRQ